MSMHLVLSLYIVEWCSLEEREKVGDTVNERVARYLSNLKTEECMST